MSDIYRKKTQAAVLLAGFLLGGGALPVAAAPPARWEVETKEQFVKGEMENVVCDADGRLGLGRIVTSTPTEELSIWASAEDAAGVMVFGSGSGTLYRLSAGKLEKAFATGQSLVTTLVAAPSGEIYVGTLPNGKIFRIAKEGTVDLFCTLPVQHVWALLPEAGGSLVVATGPGGKIFRVDKDGKSLILFDSKRDNVLCLDRDPAGRILFGTTNPGLLYGLAPDGKPSIVADFGEAEVRCLRRAPDGTLYCAVNSGVKVAPPDFLKALTDAAAKNKPAGGGGGGGSEPSAGTKTEEAAKPAAEGGGGGGGGSKPVVTGTLWRIPSDGGAPEEVVTLPDSYITDVAIEAAGTVLVATNNSGRIFRAAADGTVSVPFDFKQHQVLTLLAPGGRLKAVGTGDVGAIHLVDDAAPATGAYLSDVLDAKFPARWGTLDARLSGKLAFQTRSGNTAKPDDTWSDWSEAVSTLPAKTQSPQGRYLQFRVTWKEDREARLTAVAIAYQVSNQRPRVLELAVTDAQEQQAGSAPAPAPGQPPEVRRLPVRKIKWKAVDPDGDALVYWLSFRSVTGEAWIPINRETAIRGNEVLWNTDSVPDGRYVVRLTASDEESNPRDQVRKATRETLPFLVDNRKPEVRDLAAVQNEALVTISGAAVDTFSPIGRIEYRLDDGEWIKVAPKDGMYDDLREEFVVKLGELRDGLHVVLVRATDSAGNTTVAMTEVRVR